jgi:hypothetical protein
MPLLYSPTLGAALAARYRYLWVRSPACRTTGDVDLRELDRHRGAAVAALTPAPNYADRKAASPKISMRNTRANSTSARQRRIAPQPNVHTWGTATVGQSGFTSSS